MTIKLLPHVCAFYDLFVIKGVGLARFDLQDEFIDHHGEYHLHWFRISFVLVANVSTGTT